MKQTMHILMSALALLALTACSQDDLSRQGDTLPDGAYPLQLTAAIGTATRATTDNTWDGTETMQVQVVDNYTSGAPQWGSEVLNYTMSSSGEMQPKTDEDKVFWQAVGEKKAIRAWYAHGSGQGVIPTTHSVSGSQNTADGFAQSDFLFVQTLTERYVPGHDDIALAFYHQVAKVKVNILKGTDTPTDIAAVNGLTINNVALSGTFTPPVFGGTETGGTWTATTATTNITPKTTSGASGTTLASYEVLVIPQTVAQNTKLFTITATGYSDFVYAPKSDITWEAGKEYTYDITIKGTSLEVTSSAGITWGTGNTGSGSIILPIDISTGSGDITISDDGEYYITGTATNRTIVINGSPTVILKDANIAIPSGQDKPAIDIKGGSTTLIVEGTNNTLSSAQWGGITMSGGANLTIKGNGKTSSSLKVTANGNTGEQVSTVGIGASSNATCGYIKIQDVTLEVSGGNAWNGATGSAAIGTSTVSSTCGPIEITKSEVNATGGNGAAAIGLGYTGGLSGNNDAWHNKVESITIKESTVIATVKSTSWGECGACIGLCAAVGTAKLECGTITIENAATDFLDKLTRTGSFESVQSWKIGKGMIMGSNTGTILFSGGTFNGTSFSDGHGNW